MTGQLAKAEKARYFFTGLIRRSTCQPCDRNEAAHQLATIRRNIENLKQTINTLNGSNITV